MIQAGSAPVIVLGRGLREDPCDGGDALYGRARPRTACARPWSLPFSLASPRRTSGSRKKGPAPAGVPRSAPPQERLALATPAGVVQLWKRNAKWGPTWASIDKTGASRRCPSQLSEADSNSSSPYLRVDRSEGHRRPAPAHSARWLPRHQVSFVVRTLNVRQGIPPSFPVARRPSPVACFSVIPRRPSRVPRRPFRPGKVPDPRRLPGRSPPGSSPTATEPAGG